MKSLIFPITESAIRYLHEHMRDDDRAEMKATLGECSADMLVAMLTMPGVFGCVGYTKRMIPYFCAGLAPSSEGVMTAFAFGTDELQGQILKATKECIRVMDAVAEERGVERIVAFTQASHKRAHKWMELMRFRKAADLPGYGVDGSDFYLYERAA